MKCPQCGVRGGTYFEGHDGCYDCGYGKTCLKCENIARSCDCDDFEDPESVFGSIAREESRRLKEKTQ